MIAYHGMILSYHEMLLWLENISVGIQICFITLELVITFGKKIKIKKKNKTKRTNKQTNKQNTKQNKTNKKK